MDRDRDETPPKHDDAIKSTIEPPLDLGPDLRPGHFLFSAAIGSGGFSAVAGPMHAMSLAPALVAARSATIWDSRKKALGLETQLSKLSPGTKAKLSSAKGPARIINTASDAHQGATLDFDDLQSAKNFGAMKAYSRSKLCNILFTRELARRLRGTGVTANCLHVGFVATRFGDQSGGTLSRFVWLAKFFAISPATGAETIVYLASSPDVVATTGQYYYKRLPSTPSSAAQDDRSALLAGINE